MNILFITIGGIQSIEKRGLYPDLLRQFRDHGHHVYVVAPREHRYALPTEVINEKNTHILFVHTGNITKCGTIEKGFSTVLIERQFKNAIKKYFCKIKFDLVLYSTPPITLAGVVEYVKKRDEAATYLLLKDIFPQNAVDIGVMSKVGVKGLLYKYFRKREKKLYALSDYIGCMSQANVDYVLEHNPEISKDIVEVCPNSIEPVDMSVCAEERRTMRLKYGLPLDKVVFVYGGNLGKPQGIPFLIKCLQSQKNNKDVCFLIVGSGTEYGVIEEYIERDRPKNVKLMSRLPKEDYDAMVGSCDVGMIFLDHRFTIPNFPSRLLSYMQAKMPVLACTDPNTDIGKVITENGFGWWCESNDVGGFEKMIDEACRTDRNEMGEKAWNYLKQEYTVEKAYQITICSLNGDK